MGGLRAAWAGRGIEARPLGASTENGPRGPAAGGGPLPVTPLGPDTPPRHLTASITTPCAGTAAPKPSAAGARSRCPQRSRTAAGLEDLPACPHVKEPVASSSFRLKIPTANPPPASGFVQTSTPSLAKRRVASPAQRILVDRDHLAVRQDVAGVGRHGAQVVARHERGREHAPEAEVGLVLGGGHAPVAHLEHVRVVPVPGPRVRAPGGPG